MNNIEAVSKVTLLLFTPIPKSFGTPQWVLIDIMRLMNPPWGIGE